MLTSIIRKFKDNYYINFLNESEGNCEKQWKVINDLLNRNKKISTNVFVSQGVNITDNCVIAEGFNNYFCYVADDLVGQLGESRIPFDRSLPQPVPFSFYLRPTTCSEISSIIFSIKKKSPGHDDVNIRVIIECKEIVRIFRIYYQ